MFKSGILSFFIAVGCILCSTTVSRAQTLDALGTYTPYSMFGLGDLARPGTAYNRSMGGIGVGVRDNRFINYLNPAAVSAHDTLAFMIDFGLMQNNVFSADATSSSAFNMCNMHHIVMSFPVWKTSAMQIGFVPYSNVGYKFVADETREDILATMGSWRYYYYGQGSINQLFAAYSATFWKHFSVGLQGMYYFGNIERSTKSVPMTQSSTYATLSSGYDVVINSFGGQAGVQYSGRLGTGTELTLGATYQLGSQLKGETTRYAHSSLVDTVYSDITSGAHMGIPSEWSVGASLRRTEKWMFGVDYTQSDWSKASFLPTPGVNFTSSLSRQIKAGFEITPDRYSVRYFLRRWTYRLGAYYEQSYMAFNGNPVNTRGVTLGFSIPVYRWYNSISVTVDAGERGSIKNNMTRERYLMFIFNFSLQDVWFLKQRYD